MSKPMYEQIKVVKNMVKVLGTLFKNEPTVENTSVSFCDGYMFLAINEYEIWWEDGKSKPKEFTIFVNHCTPGTYWEPPDCDVIELGRTDTLYAAVLYVVQHNITQVYNQFMEGEEECQIEKELEIEAAEAEANWMIEAGKYAYACGYHD